MSLATVADSLNRTEEDQLKVLWFDAHPDINTYQSSPSKNFHGMPLSYLTGLDENDRSEVKILTNKIIRSIEQDHAIYFTGTSKGNMIVAGESVLIMETTPAAYLAIACNEALKAANVKLIHIQPFGASGRLTMSGPESEIDSAAEAAQKILSTLNEMQANKSGTQLG